MRSVEKNYQKPSGTVSSIIMKSEANIQSEEAVSQHPGAGSSASTAEERSEPADAVIPMIMDSENMEATTTSDAVPSEMDCADHVPMSIEEDIAVHFKGGKIEFHSQTTCLFLVDSQRRCGQLTNDFAFDRIKKLLAKLPSQVTLGFCRKLRCMLWNMYDGMSLRVLADYFTAGKITGPTLLNTVNVATILRKQS